jgi:hypothetical protein
MDRMPVCGTCDLGSIPSGSTKNIYFDILIPCCYCFGKRTFHLKQTMNTKTKKFSMVFEPNKIRSANLRILKNWANTTMFVIVLVVMATIIFTMTFALRLMCMVGLLKPLSK